MIDLSIDTSLKYQTFTYLQYFDAIQKKEISLPVSDEDMSTQRLILEKRCGTPPKIVKITVYIDEY